MEANKKQIAREALQALAEIEQTTQMENLVKDNKIEFTVEGGIYRVRKPSFIERQEIDTARRKKYLEFINDASFFFKRQWVDKYKAKGIDINAMEQKIKSYQGEIESVLLRLAVAVEPKDVEVLKKEIYKIRDEQFSLSIEVTDLLNFSIENQLTVFVNSFTTYLVLEKKIEDNWKKVYENYDEFMKSNDKCIEQAFLYINYLIYQYVGENK
jgi:ribonucleotide reductase alpha subunit